LKNWGLTLSSYLRCGGKLRPWREQPLSWLCLGIPILLGWGGSKFPYSFKLKRFNLKKFNLKTFPTKNAKAEQPPTLQTLAFGHAIAFNLQPSTKQPPTKQPPTKQPNNQTTSNQTTKQPNNQTTSNLQPPTFNLQPSTFNLQPSTSNLQPPTLQTFNLPTFNLQPLTLNP
ncbi:hypothetical protein, partial [Moorena sp. SIO3I6]|uniref:hypothetical protein n=1 Tax=Moorena sp. SIO3I6 TaxID=2607831 RepID=UPI0025D18E91